MLPTITRAIWRLILSALVLAGCGFDEIAGRSMGTTYAIQADCPGAVPTAQIGSELERINALMSTYDPDSELSVFNRAAVGVEMAASPATVEVVDAARLVTERTGGAFDATVAPLVALWGFGAGAVEGPPSPGEVSAALATVGYRRLRLGRHPPSLRKLAPVTLDLSAIAKGYAVDRMAHILDEAGCGGYLVEFGGELRAQGPARGGGPWRIGVESPAGETIASSIAILRGGLATSGDYRQYREHDGVRVSHVIDPRTGYPIRHRLASVTVVADSAMFADAYATALLVMGEEEGRRFAEEQDLAALFIVRTASGFMTTRSPAMAAYLR